MFYFLLLAQVILKLCDKVSRLNILLEKRSGKLEKLEKMVGVLATKSEENERRIELERNKRKQKQVIMQEIFMKRQLKTGVPLSRLSVLPGTKAGEVSKEFWVLRSHQNNLISTTRSFIYQIIRATAAAGVVSKKVGKCAVNCTIPDHDCAASFYESLLVRVGESPTTLQHFLQLMEKEFMQPIFAKMLKDVG